MRLAVPVALLAGLAVAAPAAGAAQDRTVSVSPAATKATWTGATGAGLNASFFTDGVNSKIPPGTCAKDPNTMCDITLVHVTGEDIGDGTLTFRIDGFQPYSDFDLRLYESDATGAAGSDLTDAHGDVAATSPAGGNDPRETFAGDYETTAIGLSSYLDGAGGPLDAYFLVEVPYFMVANDKYDGHVTMTSEPFVPEEQ